MNKILSLLLVFLFTIGSVIAVGDLAVTDVVDPGAGNPGATVLGSFKVQNTGANTINSISFVRSDLVNTVDSTSKIISSSISFNPASLASLSAGQTSSAITSSVLIPQNTKPGLYAGNVEARDNTGAHSAVFALNVNVNNFPKVSVNTFTDTNALTIKEEQGEKATGSFVIKNDGNIVLSNLDVSHNITLVDNDNDAIILRFLGTPASLNLGSTATINIEADISDKVDFGTYSGIVTVKDLVQNVQTTFKLEIKVEPKVCSDGVRSNGNPGGSNLILDIDEPSSGDDFAPSEEIKLEVNVDNNNNKDMDVILEAFLFDLSEDEILVEGETESINIEDGKSEDFELILKVPSDADVDNEFALFVKAFEEDDEDKNCGEERQDIEIKRNKHSVIIEKLTFTPSTLACGETFDVAAELLNIGTTKEDDVSVRLVDDELKIDLVSNQLTIDKFGNREDEATVRFRDVKVPTNIETKQYQVETLLTFDDDRTESKFGTITVNKCEKDVTTGGETKKVNLQLLVSSFDVKEGNAFSVPATVTNTDKVQTQYIVEMQNTGDFAEGASSKTLTLNPGQSETVFFNLRVKDNLVEGKYTGTLVVKSGNNVLDTKSVTVNLQKAGIFAGFTNGLSGNRVLWIIADVILVIIAIFFIKLIFTRRKAKE